jgi:uncharacterized protein (UPF0335 family)
MSNENSTQAASVIAQILALRSQEDDIKADVRAVYADAKSSGFDKTALGAAVDWIRKRNAGKLTVLEERETIRDLLVDAYDRGTVHATHTHTHDGSAVDAVRARSKARTSASMADHKIISAELLRCGTISETGYKENIALADALATKIGAGVIASADGDIPAFLDSRANAGQ